MDGETVREDDETVLGGETVSGDDTARDDDAGLAALRQVADHTTVQSVKQTVLACLLIWTVRRPKARRRGTVTALALSAGLVIAHYWHVWLVLFHLSP